MLNALTNIWISFVAGLLAPLGAVCVLPLYPGFISYLSSQMGERKGRANFLVLGLMVMLGVVTSMFIVGLIFTKLLSASLTNAIEIISPIAFGILALVSVLLINNYDLGKLFPQIHAPIKKNPFLSSFLFGLLFGAIALPCNPAPLIVLFALSTTSADFFLNLMNFLAFGIGMGFPLLVFAIISGAKSEAVIGFFTKYKARINRIAGIIMLGISFYYLLKVFTLNAITGMTIMILYLIVVYALTLKRSFKP